MLMILGLFGALMAGAAADTIMNARLQSTDDDAEDDLTRDDDDMADLSGRDVDGTFPAAGLPPGAGDYSDAFAPHDLLSDRVHSSDLFPPDPTPDPVLAVTTAAQPVATGGPLDDLLAAGATPSFLAGHGGQDILVTTRADGQMIGGEGDDRMLGGAGDDRMEGCAGDDWMLAGGGENTLLGGEGDDTLIGHAPGGDGHDTGGRSFLNGGAGDDMLLAGAGDYLHAGDGNDVFGLGDWLAGRDVVTLVDFQPTEDQILLHYDPARLPSPQVDIRFDPGEPDTAQIWLGGQMVAQVLQAPSLTAADVGLVPIAGPGSAGL